VRVDVGDQGSVSEGTIEFTANGDRNDMSCCEMKLFRAQMMKMLRGLLPDLTPSTIADVARLQTTPSSSVLLVLVELWTLDSDMVYVHFISCLIDAGLT